MDLVHALPTPQQNALLTLNMPFLIRSIIGNCYSSLPSRARTCTSIVNQFTSFTYENFQSPVMILQNCSRGLRFLRDSSPSVQTYILVTIKMDRSISVHDDNLDVPEAIWRGLWHSRSSSADHFEMQSLFDHRITNHLPTG